MQGTSLCNTWLSLSHRITEVCVFKCFLYFFSNGTSKRALVRSKMFEILLSVITCFCDWQRVILPVVL